MKHLNDLSEGLKRAKELGLIHTFDINSVFIDVNFIERTPGHVEKVISLRDYIYLNYKDVIGIDYMPLFNRLRVYLCQPLTLAE
jgi:hypothetical protein